MILKAFVEGVLALPMIILLAQAASDKTGSVEILVADADGNPLPYEFVELRSADSRRASFLGHCDHRKCTALPFGPYEYVLARTDVRSPRMSDLRGKLVVRFPEAHLTLTPPGVFEKLADGREVVIDYGPPLRPMDGRVVGMSDTAGSWIRFMNPFTEASFEIPIHRDGTFRIPEPPPFGTYVMLVISKGNIIGTQTVRFKDPPDRAPILVDVRHSQR